MFFSFTVDYIKFQLALAISFQGNFKRDYYMN